MGHGTHRLFLVEHGLQNPVQPAELFPQYLDVAVPSRGALVGYGIVAHRIREQFQGELHGIERRLQVMRHHAVDVDQ
ncbi:hypothetical protein D3C83_91950 [compost metagenome]